MTAAAALDAGLLKLVESRYYDPPRYFLHSVGDEVSWEIGKTFYQSRTGGKLPFKGTERIMATSKRSHKLPVKYGADYVRGSNGEPRLMTRAQAQRLCERSLEPSKRRAGFTCSVAQSDPDMHGGRWYRINVSKRY